MLQLPELPFAVRAMNAAGRLLRGAGLPLLPLRSDALHETARRKTGLDDFGLPHYREGLARLLESLEDEAALSPLGRSIARSSIGMSLENRLQITDWCKRHPEIESERIEGPVIIVGMGRTGTTILHDLLALDPANRVPLSWEADHPCPPPERASYQSDPRIAAVQRDLDRAEQLIPDFKKMHPMGALLPQECIRLTANDFASLIFAASFRIPSYNRWLTEQADLGPVYAAHRRTLQLLQWRCPAERWVLKSPGHLWALDAVIKEFPDARLIQTHRDPLKVVSSMTSLETTLRTMASDDVVPDAIGREWAELMGQGWDSSLRARQRGSIPAGQILDLQFRDFITRPMETVRRVYDFLGLELSGEAASSMQAHLDANPSDKYGKHSHRFSDTGLRAEEWRERYRGYCEYFDVVEEEVD
jgi:hypothetical protein